MSHPKPRSSDLPTSSSIGLSKAQPESENPTEAETDQELLSRYILCQDRIAIERLIVRHAPMVSAVCRAVTGCKTDAQDAFQATFLVLMQSAHKIRHHASLVAWLHGVAYRISTRTRSQRRRDAGVLNSNEVDQVSTIPISVCEDPLVLLARKVELEWLFRELEQLPSKLKNVLVEHYLQGYSVRDMAERMELSTSAVEGRLKRGRRLLRIRLMRHGLSLTVALGALDMLKHQLFATEVQHWCTKFQVEYLADMNSIVQGKTTIGVDPRVQTLVHGELSMLSRTLLLKSVAGLLAFATIGTIVAFGYISNGGSRPSEQIASSVVALRAADESTSLAATQLPSVVLAQQGEAAEPPEQNSDHQESEKPRQSAIAISSAGRSSPPATEPLHDTNGSVKSKPVPWTRPAGEIPTWLRPDESTTAVEARIENNRSKMHHLIEAIKFADTPLSEVIDYLANQCQVAMTIDDLKLEEEGIDRDTAISTQIPTCSLREVLDLILNPLTLSYRIRESGIQITSRSDVENSGTLRCYDLSYFLTSSEHAGSIVNTIEQSLEPHLWLSRGGTSSISIVGSMLIVVCPDNVHFQIETLFRMLSKMNLSNSSPRISSADVGKFDGMNLLPGGPGGLF